MIMSEVTNSLYPPVTGPEDSAVLSALSAEIAGGFWERGGRRWAGAS